MNSRILLIFCVPWKLHRHIGCAILLWAMQAGCGNEPQSSQPGADSETDLAPDRSATLDGILLEGADGEQPDTRGADSGIAPPQSNASVALELPVLHHFDEHKSAKGKALLVHGPLTPGLIPLQAFDYLWLVWGTPAPKTDAQKWSQAKARWGLVDNPEDPQGPPLGMKVQGKAVGLDCLLCHADSVAGDIIMGAGNSRLDLQGIYDDLEQLSKMAKQFGVAVPALPYEVHDRTGAAGANDAFGLGVALSYEYLPPPPELETHFGFQRPAAWWTLRYKSRMYTDGSGTVGHIHSMMATLLGFGLGWKQLAEAQPSMESISEYLISLEPPSWPFETPPQDARIRGRELFETHCASCHGVHSGIDASFPNVVIPWGALGTDPLRAAAFGPAEAEWLSSTWLAAGAGLESTGGYLAPPMAGIWARAPYFHNGSVPDLAAVLDPASRPTRWRRLGSSAAHYDIDRVGWRVEVLADEAPPAPADTVEGRRVVDTTRPGMGAQGHMMGGSLSPAERQDLLAYLKGL